MFLNSKTLQLSLELKYFTIYYCNDISQSLVANWPAQPDNLSTIKEASVIAFSVCSLSVCLFSITFFLILPQYNICLMIKFLLGQVVRGEFRATYCCLNIFCHEMITSGRILVCGVSIEPYWSAQYDRIFESGSPALLVAKIETKTFIHIWVI